MKRTKTKIVINKGYMPLYWCKGFPVAETWIDSQELLDTARGCNTPYAIELRKSTLFKKNISKLGARICEEWVQTCALMNYWMRDKQVLHITPEFDTLICDMDISEDDACVVEAVTNAWSFIPFDTFCIDLTDAPKLTTIIGYTQIYVHFFRTEEAWSVKISAFEDGSLSLGSYSIYGTVENKRAFAKRNNLTIADHTIENDAIKKFICLFANYLASEHADIEETEESAEQYVMPEEGSVPENVISEVCIWNIGSHNRVSKEQFFPCNVSLEGSPAFHGKWNDITLKEENVEVHFTS